VKAVLWTDLNSAAGDVGIGAIKAGTEDGTKVETEMIGTGTIGTATTDVKAFDCRGDIFSMTL
jgi:hypothetical protein